MSKSGWHEPVHEVVVQISQYLWDSFWDPGKWRDSCYLCPCCGDQLKERDVAGVAVYGEQYECLRCGYTVRYDNLGAGMFFPGGKQEVQLYWDPY